MNCFHATSAFVDQIIDNFSLNFNVFICFSADTHKSMINQK